MRKSRRTTPKRTRIEPLRITRAWLTRHLQVALESLGRLSRTPLPTVMTVSVIAIALALPAGLYVITRNLGALSEVWSETAAISLFLKTDVDSEEARVLAEKLGKEPELVKVTLTP